MEAKKEKDKNSCPEDWVLSEKDKNRILNEEIFRKKVLKELKLSRKPPVHNGYWMLGKLWKFVNSAFGLWVLSSLVLGGITFLYTLYTESAHEKIQKSATIDRLDTEISKRIAELDYGIMRVNETEEDKKEARLLKALKDLRHPQNPIFPEFNERPLSSLLFERTHMMQQKNPNRAKFQTLFENARDLENKFQSASGSQDIDVPAVLLSANTLSRDCKLVLNTQ